MRGNGKPWVLTLCLVLGVSGCGSPPEPDMNLAKAALDKAVAAGADKYARESLKVAQQAQAALDAELKAQKSVWFKSYAKAQDLAIAAQAAGDKAADDAASGRTKFMARAISGEAPSGPNLIRNGDFSEGLDGWGRVPTASVEVRVERSDKARSELRIHVTDAAQHVVLLQGITVKPDTPYVYEMEVKSTGRVVALYWESEVGRFNSETNFPDWTKLRYVFVTPPWDGRPRYANFHPVLTKGVGDVSIRNVGLAELKTANN